MADTLGPKCAFCQGMRTRCTCEVDCGERGFHVCGKAPEDEIRARLPRCGHCGKIETGRSEMWAGGVDAGTEWWSEVAVVTARGDAPDDVVCQLGEDEDSQADAEFIANARADVPWLLARVGELEAEIQTVERECYTRAAEALVIEANRKPKGAREVVMLAGGNWFTRSSWLLHAAGLIRGLAGEQR